MTTLPPLRANPLTVLSIDASTVATGLAEWSTRPEMREKPERCLRSWALLLPSHREAYSSRRSAWIIGELERQYAGRRLDVVVCEVLVGQGVHRAPELDALIRDLRKWAAAKKAVWKTVTPLRWKEFIGGKRATWAAGNGWDEQGKRWIASLLRQRMEWPGGSVERGAPPDTEQGWNAYDAVGIGYWYLSLLRLGLQDAEPRKAAKGSRKT